MRAKESETGHYEAHELLEIVTRLKEVRLRFVRNAGDGDRFDHAEERLDSIILDLNEWLKPGGHPVELDDLSLRLAAVEEMIEGLGFPGYAHVIASRDRNFLFPHYRAVPRVLNPNPSQELRLRVVAPPCALSSHLSVLHRGQPLG